MRRMNILVQASHECYDLIHRHRLREGLPWRLYQHLHNLSRKRSVKEAGLGKTPNRVGIEYRPKEIQSLAAPRLHGGIRFVTLADQHRGIDHERLAHRKMFINQQSV